MQALVLTATGQPLQWQDRPDLRPPPGHAVVDVKAAALNRRDYWIRQGMYPGIEPPVVLGSDGAGVVSKCGEGVDSECQGREVILYPGLNWGDDESAQARDFAVLGLPTDGTFATQIVVSASQLQAKPAYLNWEQAAALPLAGLTAYRALFSQGGLRSGETVLITGIGGGVATLALQFAVAAGAVTWVTSSSKEKIRRAVELGAQGGFDYSNENWPKEMSQQAGAPSLIIDSAGGAGYAALIKLAAPGGRIVNYGATAGPPEKLDLFKVFWKQLRLLGSTMGSPADFAAMLELAEKHSIRPTVDRVFPLAEGNEAINLMESSPQFGKYVLVPTDARNEA